MSFKAGERTKKTTASVVAASFFIQLLSPIGIFFASPAVAFAEGNNYCGVPAGNYPATTPDIGGVTLDKAATFLADMDDITGAYYDENTDQIVFIGTATSTLPNFHKDDLAVAMRAIIFNNTNPAASMDFPPGDNSIASTTYYGGIEETNFGNVLIYADYAMKKLQIGYDENEDPVTSSVPGYESVVERYEAIGPDPEPTGHSRYWISPQSVTLRESTTTDAFVFDEVIMQVQHEALDENNDPAWNEASEDFVEHHTQYYDDFAAEIEEYQKTKQLAKIVGVVKWIKDNIIGTGADYEWALNYAPDYVDTPEFVDSVSAQIHLATSTITVTGGAALDIPNTYEEDTAGTSSVLAAASAAASASSTDGIHWQFGSGGQNYTSVAVSAELFRASGSYTHSTVDASAATASDVPLEVRRTYSSFAAGRDVGFGPGWSVLPASLTNKFVGASVSCTTIPGKYSGSYPYKIAVVTPSGRENFTFSSCPGGYAPDDPRFRSTLSRDADGTFRVETKNQDTFLFYTGTPTTTSYKLIESYNPRSGGPNNLVRKYYWSAGTTTLATIQDIDPNDSVPTSFNGHNLALSYNEDGRIASVTSPAGTVTYGYDGNGDLVTVTDPRSGTTSYAYHSGHLLKSVTDRTGTRVVDNTYDPLHRISTQVNAGGVTTTIAYDDENSKVSWTDSNGRTGSDVYDASARVIQRVNAAGATTTFAYSSSYTDAPTSITDARNNTISFSYDSDGNVLTYTPPGSSAVTYTWDSANNLTQISDARYSALLGSPRLTKYTYDANNNLTQSTVAGAGTTTYSYTPQGLVATTTDSDGEKLEYFYNAYGLATKVRNQLGQDTLYAYDSAGNLTQITDPTGATTTRTYDANGNLLTSTNAVSTASFSYDASDRLVSTVDPAGATTTFTYGSRGNLATTTNPLGAATQYSYDQYNNLVKVTDALSRDVEYSYDVLNRATERELASGKTYASQYDLVGNTTVATQPNGTVATSTYDSLNRLTTKVIDGETFTYAYDSASRLKTVANDTGTTTYSYDARDRITEIENPYGAVVEYEYDDLDNITQISYPDDKTVQNQFDDAGRLTQQTDWNSDVTEYTYNSIGLLSTTTLPNGITVKRTYDDANRLASVTYRDSGQSIVFREQYVRDARGNLIEVDEDGAGVSTAETTYDYDLTNRITDADTALADERFAYDQVGNLTTRSYGAATTSYTHTIDNELATSTASSSGMGGAGEAVMLIEQILTALATATDTPMVEAQLLPDAATTTEPVPEVIFDIATTTATSSEAEPIDTETAESTPAVATSTDTVSPGASKPVETERKGQLINGVRDARMWQAFHAERVAALEKMSDLPPESLAAARYAKDKFDTYLVETGYTEVKGAPVEGQTSEAVLNFITTAFHRVLDMLIPDRAYAYLFGLEDFESCGSLPCSFSNTGGWGSVTQSLDATSKVAGVDSLKEVVSGEGSGILEKTNLNEDEVWVQFKVFIPSSMAWGGSGYFSTFRFEDSSDGTIFWMNIEDWGTPRLTFDGDTLPWTDSGITLTENAVNTIEVRFKKGTTDGDVDIWHNNTTEGSPSYNGSGSMNTGTDNVDDVHIGMAYAPETGISTTYYDDVAIDTSFIGTLVTNNAPTAPSALLTEGSTNPTDITDSTPEFSAVYNDSDAGDIATHYRLQVSTSSSFTTTYWDTGSTTLASSTSQGNRIADISYSGSTLASSTTYYWRIKFWDDSAAEGSWSTSTATFSLAAGSTSSATSSYQIYDDSLHADWEDWSWDTTVDFGHSGTVHDGTDAMQVAYTAAWGGLDLHFTEVGGFDASEYDTLDFWIRGEGAGGQNIFLYITDEEANDHDDVAVTDYLSGGISSSTWKKVSIPVEDIEVHVHEIDQLIMLSSASTTIYIDELEFVGTTSSGGGSTDTTFAYDNSGNLLSATNENTTKSFTWNVLGLLDTATVNGSSTTFTYDAAGNRIAKTADTTTRYVNDTLAPNALVLAETNTSNTIERYNVWGPDGLVSTGEASSSQRYYPLTDHHGSVRLLTDSAGNVVNAYTYTTYGEVTAASSTPDIPYQYTSEQHDDETGLVYLRARYYDPELGRFISRDSIQGTLDNPLSQHPYQYALNNPSTYSDPSGEFVSVLIAGWVALTTFPELLDATSQVTGSVGNFAQNYSDMREANTIGADKYFHCVANCESAQLGPYGSHTACAISTTREAFDQYIKGDPVEASRADQEANVYGRTGGEDLYVSCQEVCSVYRPSGLDQRY